MTKLSTRAFLSGVARILSAKPQLPRSLEDNTLLRTILERRSVRKFKDDPIPADAWTAILEAGRLAPSTVNLQTWSFATFTAEKWQDFFGKPVPFGARRAVIILADVHRARRVVSGFPYAPLCEYTVGVMNASLAAMNMCMAAEALGLCSVMLSETGQTGFYDAGYLAEKLALPAGVVPIMSLVFGYAQGKPPAMPPKLSRDSVTFSGEYQETAQSDLDDWYEQQQAGFQASNWGQLFASQVAYYNRRIEEAEKDLRQLVFYKGDTLQGEGSGGG